jgi:hypothetical protein
MNIRTAGIMRQHCSAIPRRFREKLLQNDLLILMKQADCSPMKTHAPFDAGLQNAVQARKKLHSIANGSKSKELDALPRPALSPMPPT